MMMILFYENTRWDCGSPLVLLYAMEGDSWPSVEALQTEQDLVCLHSIINYKSDERSSSWEAYRTDSRLLGYVFPCVFSEKSG